MHLNEDRVQRFLHGELSPPEELAARAHLADCADCRRRVDQAEREEHEVDALLRQVDDPAPPLESGAIAARARAHAGPAHLLQRAAGFLLALGIAGAAYAAYAAPGSPVRAWVSAMAEWMGGHPQRQAPAAGSAGIAVAPGQALVIVFTSSQAEGRAEVWLTDRADVAVRGPIGSASFTSEAERLVIDNRGSSATYQIEIPRSAPRVEIRVGESRVFLKEGQRVMAGATADTTAPYLLPLAPS